MKKIFAAKARSFAVVLKKYSARCQRGAILLFFVALLPVLLGFMGLAVDFGLAYSQKGKIQDIADAAALAGAVHISDTDDRDGNIAKQVKNYVEANGLTVNSMVLKNTLAAWDSLETLAVGENCCVAYGVVTVNTDGVDKERLRVRITKRSPSFFLNVLGDFSDGLTVNALAAAEGNSVAVAPVESSYGPIFMTGNVCDKYYTSPDQVVLPYTYYEVYEANATVNLDLLPGVGTVYAQQMTKNGKTYTPQYFHIDQNDHTKISLPYMEETGGWMICSGSEWGKTNYEYPDNCWDGEWNAQYEADVAAVITALKDAEKEKRNNVIKNQETSYNVLLNDAKQVVANVESSLDSFKNPAAGSNKRYISATENNIKDTDTEIELYVDGTSMIYNDKYNDGTYQGSDRTDGDNALAELNKVDQDAPVTAFEGQVGTNMSVLTNTQLKNVTKVSKLYFSSKASIIATNGKSFGDVYFTGSQNDISGDNNSFIGTLYDVNQWGGSGELWVGGYDNKYKPVDGKPAFFTTKDLYLGMTHRRMFVQEVRLADGTIMQVVDTISGTYKWGEDSNWKIYIGDSSSVGTTGSGSGSSGSESGSGSASGASTKLRLVE